MRIIIIISLFIGIIKVSFCSSGAEDDRTLTELLFNGQAGTIFTCKILTMTTPPKHNDNNDSIVIISKDGGENGGTSTAKIIKVYFGVADSSVITLNTGSFLQIGKTYLIYTNGVGTTFNCWNRTKQITDIPDSTFEVLLVKQFSDIFKNKTTGKFSFKNAKGIMIAEGKYKKGIPVGIWKHYYDNGIIKAEYDLKNDIISQYFANGFIKNKITIIKNKDIYEAFSTKVNGQLERKAIEIKNDTGMVVQYYEYYDSGNLKNVYGYIYINLGGSSCEGKTGTYEEYYENGKLKLKGQYDHKRRVGLWRWYYENGEFYAEYDYKDGANGEE
ncbi:MAG: hypothetical protein WC223_01550 [Bacteroidales bacterium]|jgi:antitoxin component YwqK of YwqJK toxin-antitoxin module